MRLLILLFVVVSLSFAEDYCPLAVGNQWVYSGKTLYYNSSYEDTIRYIDTMDIVGDTVIDSVHYYIETVSRNYVSSSRSIGSSEKYYLFTRDSLAVYKVDTSFLYPEQEFGVHYVEKKNYEFIDIIDTMTVAGKIYENCISFVGLKEYVLILADAIGLIYKDIYEKDLNGEYQKYTHMELTNSEIKNNSAISPLPRNTHTPKNHNYLSINSKKGELHLTVPNKSQIVITLFTANGKVLVSRRFYNPAKTIKLSSFNIPSGNYIVQINGDGIAQAKTINYVR